MNNNDNLMLGLALIVGAVFYSRSHAATVTMGPQYTTGPAPLGVGSMPGSVGTGAAQVVGGLLGNLFSAKPGGGPAQGTVAQLNSSTLPILAGDPNPQTGMPQNSVTAADPFASYDPTAAGSAIDMSSFYA